MRIKSRQPESLTLVMTRDYTFEHDQTYSQRQHDHHDECRIMEHSVSSARIEHLGFMVRDGCEIPVVRIDESPLHGGVYPHLASDIEGIDTDERRVVTYEIYEVQRYTKINYHRQRLLCLPVLLKYLRNVILLQRSFRGPWLQLLSILLCSLAGKFLPECSLCVRLSRMSRLRSAP